MRRVNLHEVQPVVETFMSKCHNLPTTQQYRRPRLNQVRRNVPWQQRAWAARAHAHTHTVPSCHIQSIVLFCQRCWSLLKPKNPKSVALNIISMSSKLKKPKHKDYPKYLTGGFIPRKPWDLQHTRPRCISVNELKAFSLWIQVLTVHFDNLHFVAFVNKLAW